MTTRGTVELRAVTWTWNAIERWGESGETVSWRVLLHVEGSPDSEMKLEVPGDTSLTSKTVKEFARSPDERSLVRSDDVQWTFWREDRKTGPLGGGPPLEPPHLVAFRSNLGAAGTGDLPQGVSLGEAKDEELDAIIERWLRGWSHNG